MYIGIDVGGTNLKAGLVDETGKILAVEENWIKVEEKKKIRLINGDMIRDIAVNKAK